MSSRQPQVIASRYIERLVAGRNHEKYCEGLILQLREAIGTIKYYALRERSQVEEMLLVDMEARGDTRRKSHKRLQELAVEGGRLESLVRYWEEDVLGRCEVLLGLVDEFPSAHFTSSFMDLVRRIIDEVSSSDWTSEPPHPSAWTTIPTFFDKDLIAMAKVDNAEAGGAGQAGKTAEKIRELWTWNGIMTKIVDENQETHTTAFFQDLTLLPSNGTVPAAADGALVQNVPDSPPLHSTRGNSALQAKQQQPSSRFSLSTADLGASIAASASASGGVLVPPAITSKASVRLAVSCMCVDASDPWISTVYFGTERGLIFSLPIESLYPKSLDDIYKFQTREVQECLSKILERRSRMEEVAAQLSVVSSRSTSRQGNSASPNSSGSFMLQEGPVRVYFGHVYGVCSLQVVSHGERGKLLISSSLDKSVRWFNAATGAVVGIAGPERAVCDGAIAYLRGPDAILTGHFDGGLRLWDVQSGSFSRSLVELPKCPIHSCHVVLSSAFTSGTSGSPSGDSYAEYTVIIGCRNGHVYGFHLKTMPSKQGAAAINDDVSNDAMNVTHCFLPDHAVGSLLSLPNGVVAVRGGHTKAVTKLASMANYLFTADSDGLVIKWDAQRAEKLLAFDTHIDEITSLSVTSDEYLFTSSRDGLWIVWHAGDGRMLRRVGRHYHQVVGLAVGYRCPLAAVDSSSGSSPLPAATLTPSSPVPSTTATSAPVSPQTKKKGKGKKGAQNMHRTQEETPFPLIPKSLRKHQPGSRECVYLDSATTAAVGEPADAAHSALEPFVLTVSKDDSILVWSFD